LQTLINSSQKAIVYLYNKYTKLVDESKEEQQKLEKSKYKEEEVCFTPQEQLDKMYKLLEELSDYVKPSMEKCIECAEKENKKYAENLKIDKLINVLDEDISKYQKGLFMFEYVAKELKSVAKEVEQAIEEINKKDDPFNQEELKAKLEELYKERKSLNESINKQQKKRSVSSLVETRKQEIERKQKKLNELEKQIKVIEDLLNTDDSENEDE